MQLVSHDHTKKTYFSFNSIDHVVNMHIGRSVESAVVKARVVRSMLYMKENDESIRALDKRVWCLFVIGKNGLRLFNVQRPRKGQIVFVPSSPSSSIADSQADGHFVCSNLCEAPIGLGDYSISNRSIMCLL